MSDPAPVPGRMTADEFIPWAMNRPEGEHYELYDGEVEAMAPERSVHARTKGHIYRRLAEAVEAAGLPCEVYPDGMAVLVDATTVYEPDALLRCGPPVPPDAVQLTDPLIVVEVVSPSSRIRDGVVKLIDYFRLPTVQHYLIVQTGSRTVIHHARQPDGSILTRILGDGAIHLDPPGLTLADPFPAAG